MQARPLPITSPFNQSEALSAPRAQPPPSNIPTDRLAVQADDWAQGRGASPALPPPKPSYIAAGLANQHMIPPPPSSYAQNGGYPGQPIYSDADFYGQGQDYAAPAPAPGPPPLQPMPSSAYAGPQHQQPYFYNDQQQSNGPGYYQQQHLQPPAPPPQQYYHQPAPPPPPPQSTSFQSTYAQQAPPPPPPPPNMMPLPPISASAPPSQQRPPRIGSMMSGYGEPSTIDAAPHPGPAFNTYAGGRPNYYATPEDGPPYKLAVTHPDQKMLASMRETAHAGGGDMHKKVAWAKQVLKFIERHQAQAGESSRINDPLLVRWTDEALNHILSSAASNAPVPLALYLRGDLSATGSFPSYRPKDTSGKSSFRDFEAAANAGYVKAWFRIGRSYEDFGDVRRAVGAYERGVEKGDCGSTYRLAMAYLLGQIGVVPDVGKALALLRRAADTADLDTPQPPYILGMLLNGEFDSPAVTLQKDLIPLNIDEAKWRIERSAYLSFGPALYKMGFSYEYATLGCLFDPLLSVQYYALASQNGEVEADMALSKWYLCGSEGNFDSNEHLAWTFAEKAASRQLPSAEFALGYFCEVGIARAADLDQARRWYQRAASHGNSDAKQRLDALGMGDANALSRADHETQVDTKLVRKRTQAKVRSDEQRMRQQQYAQQQQQQQQQQYKQHQPQHQQFQQPQQGPRYGGNGQSSYGSAPVSTQSATIRRRDTLRQVEAAAGRISQTPSTPTIPSSNHGQHRQSYQLSDRPASRLSTDSAPAKFNASGGSALPAGRQQQSIPVQQHASKPATFAEMGIKTQAAKRDECSIM